MTAGAGLLVVWHWLLAYGAALARPLALLAISPVFSRFGITGLLRGAIATAFCLPEIPRLFVTLAAAPPPALGLVLLGVKEAAVGGALGLLSAIPLWALDVAGDVLDAQRGATQGRLNDPAGFADVSITGTLLMVTGVALFVATGGLDVMARLLYGSWALWPPLDALPQLGPATPSLLLGVLDRVTEEGLLLAVPPVLAMLLADATLLAIARIAPSLRIDDLGLAVRNTVFVVFMPLYAGFLILYMRQDLAAIPHTLDLLLPVVKAAGAGHGPVP